MLRIALIATALLAAPLAAQDPPEFFVDVTGRIALLPEGGPGGFGIVTTHELECAFVELGSETVDLTASEGELVRVLGSTFSISGDPDDPIEVNVSSLEPPQATLVWCGTPQLNCDLRIEAGPGGISQHFIFASLDQAYTPVGNKGTLLIADPFLIVSGVANSSEGFVVVFDVPDDPALVGLTFYMQNARRNVGPVGPLRLSNAICITISGAIGPPCLDTGAACGDNAN